MELVKTGEFSIPLQLISGAIVGYSSMGVQANLECKVVLLYDIVTEKYIARIGAGMPEFVKVHGAALSFQEASGFFKQLVGKKDDYDETESNATRV